MQVRRLVALPGRFRFMDLARDSVVDPSGAKSRKHLRDTVEAIKRQPGCQLTLPDLAGTRRLLERFSILFRPLLADLIAVVVKPADFLLDPVSLANLPTPIRTIIAWAFPLTSMSTRERALGWLAEMTTESHRRTHITRNSTDVQPA